MVDNLRPYMTSAEISRAELRRSVWFALKAGMTYEQIEKELGASTATIARVRSMMNKRGCE